MLQDIARRLEALEEQKQWVRNGRKGGEKVENEKADFIILKNQLTIISEYILNIIPILEEHEKRLDMLLEAITRDKYV